jgi:tRNA(fMet)-specific endonuclease VapC
MERLIVDTGVVIAVERGELDVDRALPDSADIALAAITASELLVGVELADEAHRDERRALVDAVIEGFDVLPFELETARQHALLLAHARRTGRPRGAHDLLVAATARASSRVLVTTDARAFDDLPGVTFRLVEER